jgi:2-polyprenyl-3-methyl-5-hydroxy-6-metoxy-1,4-benzoquinol methylase
MEHVRCNLCGADDAIVRYPCTIRMPADPENWSAYACTHSGYGHHHTIVECARCGLVYSSPRFDNHDIVGTYEAVEDALYVEEREGRVLTFEHHLKPLEHLTGPPSARRLLDVGCHVGVFVEIADQHGWEAWGVDPSRWAVEQGRQRQLRLVQGTLESAQLPGGDFDVVTMWDTIEHLPDPAATLSRAHALMARDGLLVVHTIDIDSAFARLMGSRWPWLMEMHLFYFSRRTLRAMLAKCGFEVLSDRPQGRYLRLGYLANRVAALAPVIGRPAEWLVTKLRLRSRAVHVNLGDLITVYARRL